MCVHRLPANTRGRDFVVGDLHGCVAALHRLLQGAAFDPACDRLFSVGDLVDRGPDSQAALGLLDAPWFVAVRGNHEQMMIDAVLDVEPEARAVWEANGGAWARDAEPAVLRAAAERLATLPLALVVGTGAARFHVVHAELEVDDAALDAGDLVEQARVRALWGRSIVHGRPLPRPGPLSLTYCGHTPVPAPRRHDGHLFIDTGAVFPGGRLTLICHQSGSVHQTPARGHRLRRH